MLKSPFNLVSNQLKKIQIASEGFPWLLAMSLYSVSWGWSLLRPNTLYWDDWTYIYNRPKSYLNQIFVDTGLPPWRAIIDQELISVGYWTIPVLTFLFFFASGLLIYIILKKFEFVSDSQRKLATLIALLLPVNHSRISLQMFGYTTSYFLFFLAWLLLIYRQRQIHFGLTALLFLWSFMTHSFLFFYILPLGHYLFLNKSNIVLKRAKFVLSPRTLVLFVLPPLYYTLRHYFWPPTEEYKDYHKLTVSGAMRGLTFFAIGVIMLMPILIKYKSSKSKDLRLTLIFGWIFFAWGLFPYFVNQSYINMISVFAFRADWGSRHSLLTPLGAGLIICGLASLLRENSKKIFTNLCIIMFVCCNVFFGSQYFVDSIKKEQLVDLFRITELPIENRNIIFVDNTKKFNGRFSTYRNTELNAIVEMSGKKISSISGKTSCNEVSNGAQVTLRSEQGFVTALYSRDLKLQFDFQEC